MDSENDRKDRWERIRKHIPNKYVLTLIVFGLVFLFSSDRGLIHLAKCRLKFVSWSGSATGIGGTSRKRRATSRYCRIRTALSVSRANIIICTRVEKMFILLTISNL